MTRVPSVADRDVDEAVWYPLQHALGIETFGANVFVATERDQALVEKHDESASGQQELYVILEGAAVFELDGQEARVEAGTALAVTDPAVARSATALTAGTTLLVVGASSEAFRSTWDATHFVDIPRPG